MAQTKRGANNRTDVTSRSAPEFKNPGFYNKATLVGSNKTIAFTGSTIAAGFICENVTNVTIELQNGGTLPGSTLTADTLYEIAPKKVVIGATGVVHVLHK